jgi:hypothetical protein
MIAPNPMALVLRSRWMRRQRRIERLVWQDGEGLGIQSDRVGTTIFFLGARTDIVEELSSVPAARFRGPS